MTRVETIARLLQAENTLALATDSEGGVPHVAPLFYLAAADLGVYWFSSPSSVHSRNLKRNPAAAITIYPATERWREIRGVQMAGRACPVTDPAERRTVVKAYTEVFCLGNLWASAIRSSRLYRFRPTWVRYIDNSRRPGYKFEVRL